MAITVRPARLEDLPMLQEDLARDGNEQVDLRKGIVFVAEKDGEIVEFISARLLWQVEPLKGIHGWEEKCSDAERRKATYLLIKKMDGWLANRKNNPLIRAAFFFVNNEKMQKLLLNARRKLGIIHIPRRPETKLLGKDY